MKMPDGGFRPAYNVEFATAIGSQVIVGADVVNVGGDGGQMGPMVEQIEDRYGEAPREYVVDGGFSTLEDIEAVGQAPRGTTVYTPVKEEEKKRKKGVDPFQPLPKDSEVVGAWRQRMGTPRAKEMAKLPARRRSVSTRRLGTVACCSSGAWTSQGARRRVVALAAGA